VDWKEISANQILSERFIEKHSDKVNWENISSYQKLSESFIEKHLEKLSVGGLSSNRKISNRIKDKFNIIEKLKEIYRNTRKEWNIVSQDKSNDEEQEE
jgi:hypothetical protein